MTSNSGGVQGSLENEAPGLRATRKLAVSRLSGVICDRAMAGSQFFDDQFKAAVRAAGAQARIETLQAGVPVFYRGRVRNLNIIEHPNGRKFEIRFIDGAPGDRNYELLRELDETAA